VYENRYLLEKQDGAFTIGVDYRSEIDQNSVKDALVGTGHECCHEESGE